MAEPLAGVPLQAPALPPLASVLAFYTLVRHAPRVHVLLGGAAMLLGFVVMDASQPNGMGGLIFQMTLLAGTAITGAAVRTRTARAGVLESRAYELERERDEVSAAAIESERAHRP